MAKLTNVNLTLQCISGNNYSFELYEIDTFFEPIAGIYIITRRMQLIDNNIYHEYIYCGKTEDFSIRFNDHHKDDCIKANKANCICVMPVSSKEERTTIEKDILNSYNFKCNELLN